MLLTVKDVAARLNVSLSCVYQLVEAGRLPHHRIGLGRGAIRCSESDLSEYLAGNRESSQVSESARPPARTKLKHIKV